MGAIISFMPCTYFILGLVFAYIYKIRDRTSKCFSEISPLDFLSSYIDVLYDILYLELSISTFS